METMVAAFQQREREIQRLKRKEQRARQCKDAVAANRILARIASLQQINGAHAETVTRILGTPVSGPATAHSQRG